MLTSKNLFAIKEKYNKIYLQSDQTEETISTIFPNIAINCKKRFQKVSPQLGTVHVYNDLVYPLSTFCDRYKKQYEPINKINITTELKDTLKKLDFVSSSCHREQHENQTHMENLVLKDPNFAQIKGFITDFKKWIDLGFTANKSQSCKIYLEPFQRNLLLHVIFFIAVTKSPILANHITNFLTQTFCIDFLTNDSISLLKQKAAIFLVPRRHGKTWFTVPVICCLLKNLEGISIGYVAHQKHVSQSVLKEVEFSCKRMFPEKCIENKDNVISINHKTSKSTALFASCYNTNVSMKLYLTD